MKKVVYLHIGGYKTGSTSIQVFLAGAMELLEKQGILYPQAGRPNRKGNVAAGHHQLAWGILGRYGVSCEKTWQALDEEIKCWKGRNIVISSEVFQSLDGRQVETVVGYLDGCEVQVIVYLRNPISYLISSYKQRIKMGTYASSFRTYLIENGARLDYGSLVGLWVTMLGRKKVHLRLFDKVKKNPGIEVDFCEIIGADFNSLRSFKGSPENVSPEDKEIAILRRINRLTWWMGEKQRRWGWPVRLRAQIRRGGVRAKLARSILGAGTTNSLVKPEDIDYLRDAISERHEAFLERYVAPEDRDYLRF